MFLEIPPDALRILSELFSPQMLMEAFAFLSIVLIVISVMVAHKNRKNKI